MTTICVESGCVKLRDWSIHASMTPAQCRMARAALDWTVADLADKAQVGISTVVRFEKGRGKPIAATIAAMQRCLEAAGVRFIPNGVCFEPGSQDA
jgi:transcriptional regulator with XRE-family HTH domain